MRLVVISDTHLRHKELTLPDGDMLVHAGDFSNRGTYWDLREFADWFTAQPHEHKVVVFGNHDIVCAKEDGYIIRDLFPTSVVLMHEAAEFAGLKFFGSPWSSEIYPGSPWVFSYKRDTLVSHSIWGVIPDGTDILITHGPPYGILDLVASSFPGEDPHVGDPVLLDRVLAVKPKVHIFGHIHEASGMYQNDHTIFCNAAICDLAYKPVNPVRIIDL